MKAFSVAVRGRIGGMIAILMLPATFAGAAPAPEFERDIVPILERRCMACHNNETHEGQLGLHDRAAMEKGGESGEKIVNVPFEFNELWRRVAGDDAEVRMPPDGPPLNAEELATIERWARAGARWSAAPALPDESTWSHWFVSLVPSVLDPALERIETWRANYGSAIYLTISWFAVLLVSRRFQSSDKEPTPLALLLRRLATPARLGFAAAAIVGWAVWLHVAALHAREDELMGRVAELDRELRKRTEVPESIVEALMVARPKHPPRLGGTYFRGNDERSPKLFNGGFYRTATMHVDLCEGSGRRLAWGDGLPAGDVFVRLEIERSPMATPTLFRPAIMAKAFLSPCLPSVPSSDLASLIYRLETLKEGEQWVGRAPVEIPTPDPSGDTLLEGTFYLYNCVPKKDHISERPHFGICFRIVVKGGVIQQGSDLWMGSLYRLRKIFYPPPDRILPGEWFDFREIPVIEGTNSRDPALLGVEEHEHKLE